MPRRQRDHTGGLPRSRNAQRPPEPQARAFRDIPTLLPSRHAARGEPGAEEGEGAGAAPVGRRDRDAAAGGDDGHREAVDVVGDDDGAELGLEGSEGLEEGEAGLLALDLGVGVGVGVGGVLRYGRGGEDQARVGGAGGVAADEAQGDGIEPLERRAGPRVVLGEAAVGFEEDVLAEVVAVTQGDAEPEEPEPDGGHGAATEDAAIRLAAARGVLAAARSAARGASARSAAAAGAAGVEGGGEGDVVAAGGAFALGAELDGDGAEQDERGAGEVDEDAEGYCSAVHRLPRCKRMRVVMTAR